MQVGEDPEFLAADDLDDAVGELRLEPHRRDLDAEERERLIEEPDVLGDVEVGAGFGATQHGMNARDEFRMSEGFGDVIVAAQLQPLDLVHLKRVAGQEDGRNRDVVFPELLQQLKARLVGKVDVEEHEVGKVALQKAEGMRAKIVDLGLHPGILQVLGDELGEFHIILDHQDQRLRLRSRRAERMGGI